MKAITYKKVIPKKANPPNPPQYVRNKKKPDEDLAYIEEIKNKRMKKRRIITEKQ